MYNYCIFGVFWILFLCIFIIICLPTFSFSRQTNNNNIIIILITIRESRRFEEGLNTKVKIDINKWFDKSVEFKKYLHGVCDAGSRLLFKFRLGMHGLNEEFGRHRGREGRTKCSLCGDECENVSHVLLECSVLELVL